MSKMNILIMGAAGKDFHTFNCCYRDNEKYDVKAFTATQIPHIDGRLYPSALAGRLYPEGIRIYPEEQLVDLIKTFNVQEVVFAYSDVTYEYIVERERLVVAAGASFKCFDIDATMLPSTKPVVAICAVRTGCGKSQTARRLAALLKKQNLRGVALRHPMPYGDLEKQKLQRYSTLEDLKTHKCTIEEMEEYEPYIVNGLVIYAGVDYEAILREAEKEADIIIWDGGNNDTPFIKPDYWVTIADALRPDHETKYFPGKDNFERADMIIINKIESAARGAIDTIVENQKEMNPKAKVLKVKSPVHISDEDKAKIKGKRVVVIEDGPTCTHGGMTTGAGTVAANAAGAVIVDPRPFAIGEIAETFHKYPKTGPLLPAMGYGDQQLEDMTKTIDSADCDYVVVGTPINLARVISFKKPFVRVEYEFDHQYDEELTRLTQVAIQRNQA
eukprot:Rmarinus@m.9101